jgi:esterase
MATAPLTLAHRRQGAGPPVVLLHGLFGSGRNWVGIANALADRFEVVLPDLRNHGASPWADDCGYPALAGDVLALLDALGLRRVRLVGHSMGGKAAMVLALTAPERVERLVVADVAPVAYPPGGLGAYVRAMRAIDPGGLARRADADAALAPAVPEPAIRAFLLQNLEQRDGRLAWRLNLDALAAGLDAVHGFPALADARAYEGPTCLVRGGRSDYVTDEGFEAARGLFPGAELHTVEGAGHWLHAERPAEFLHSLLGCLGPA